MLHFQYSLLKNCRNYKGNLSNGAWIVCGGSASGAAIFPASAPITGLISGLTGMAAGYWGLLATRISANNHGKGVIIDLTWVLVFNIKPQ